MDIIYNTRSSMTASHIQMKDKIVLQITLLYINHALGFNQKLFFYSTNRYVWSVKKMIIFLHTNLTLDMWNNKPCQHLTLKKKICISRGCVDTLEHMADAGRQEERIEIIPLQLPKTEKNQLSADCGHPLRRSTNTIKKRINCRTKLHLSLVKMKAVLGHCTP